MRNDCGNLVLTRVRLHTGSRLANGVPSQSVPDYYPNSMSTYVTSHWPLGYGSVLARRRLFLCLCMCDEVAYGSKTFPTESNLCEDILILKLFRGNGAFN